jgi:signal peptidase I
MGKLLRLLFWIALLFAVLVGAARLVAIRWWRVPSDDPVLEASIAPTLRGGDWVLLWRATPPSFGSLVVCPDPEDPARVVIGRIAAEQGDRLTIECDVLRVNDHVAHSETACAESKFRIQDPNTGSDVDQYCDIEELAGLTHMRGTCGGIKTAPEPSTREVGEGKVFLVSDNRAYPYDSRAYGPIDRATCKESIFFRVVSRRGFMDVQNRFTYIR